MQLFCGYNIQDWTSTPRVLVRQVRSLDYLWGYHTIRGGNHIPLPDSLTSERGDDSNIAMEAGAFPQCLFVFVFI